MNLSKQFNTCDYTSKYDEYDKLQQNVIRKK